MTAPHYTDGPVTVWHGDCIEVMATMPAESVDAVVCDPPYGLGFMGKEWDATFVPADMPMRRNGAMDAVNAGAARQGGRQRAGEDYQKRMARDSRDFQHWCEDWATEALRVLKPGGHLLAFGGTRTFHRLTAGIEDAGFEIRDSIAWLYGSGFPKSLDVSKAIDKHLEPRAERDLTLEYEFTAWARSTGVTSAQMNEATDTDMDGHWLTPSSQPAIPTREMLERLRPLFSSIPVWVEQVVEQRDRERAEARERAERARFLDTLQARSGSRGSAAKSDALKWNGWGTALKPAFEPIVVARKPLSGTVASNVLRHGTGALNIDGNRIGTTEALGRLNHTTSTFNAKNTTPLVDNSGGLGRWPANVILDESQAAALDAQSGVLTSGLFKGHRNSDKFRTAYGAFKGDAAKEVETYGDTGGASRFFYTAKASTDERPSVDGIAHPTVKPVDLMRWLVKLVTPPGGVVLEPFAGSGTTVEAAVLEGFHCIAIEREGDYLPLILKRIRKPHAVGLDFGEWEA